MFGAPGSGKGTQGKILGTIPNFFHCACGDVFRSLRPDSPLGKTFISHSSRGRLVPDAPTIELWRQFIDASTKTGRFHPAEDTLVLDGIPRNAAQAEMLSDALDRIPDIEEGDFIEKPVESVPIGRISSPVGITATTGRRRTTSSVRPAAPQAATSTARSRCPWGNRSSVAPMSSPMERTCW